MLTRWTETTFQEYGCLNHDSQSLYKSKTSNKVYYVSLSSKQKENDYVFEFISRTLWKFLIRNQSPIYFPIKAVIHSRQSFFVNFEICFKFFPGECCKLPRIELFKESNSHWHHSPPNLHPLYAKFLH